MFDSNFFLTVLPERLKVECRRHPDDVPVVKLHLTDGRTFDLCHIVYAADKWLVVQHFLDAKRCTDMDRALLPYALVSRVDVSFHSLRSRSRGFEVPEKASLSPIETAEIKDLE